jgi:6-pyruvoyltetrahydropterin/6-carboxytetrahydropterin synthase
MRLTRQGVSVNLDTPLKFWFFLFFKMVRASRRIGLDNRPIYELKIISDFAAAHNLRNFRGKCENLHGHNWTVEVVLRGHRLDDNGILIDFAEVKQYTRELLAQLDHNYLNDLPYFRDQNPSSENIARFLFEQLKVKLNAEDRWLYSVSAWESADACATFKYEG